MKTNTYLTLCFSSLCLSISAQTNYPDPEVWPSTIVPAKTVHFVSVDSAFTAPSASWVAGDLIILTGGDQVTQPITIGGHTGIVTIGQYLNIADGEYQTWANEDTIDILMQVFGDAAVLSATGTPRTYNFLEGTLPNSNLSAPAGGSLPVEAKNQKWNWVLFSITNGIRAIDGQRYVGSLPPDA